jgi:hypothetical protein
MLYLYIFICWYFAQLITWIIFICSLPSETGWFSVSMILDGIHMLNAINRLIFYKPVTGVLSIMILHFEGMFIPIIS